jgi:hypothetical protein
MPLKVTNPVNAEEQGFQVLSLVTAEWYGRSMTPGTGIIITNQDGTAGNPVFSVDGSVVIENVLLDYGAFNPITPIAGQIILHGTTIAAGTHPIRTDGTAANQCNIEVQFSQAIASSNATNVGLSAFNSAQFTVDANGYVSMLNGLPIAKVMVDTFTGPGTNPVLPDSTGKITVTGGQVAAGTTVNVIQTDSLAANTYTIQIQRSQAVASSTVGDNGVSHFNSTYFTVDGNGFVSIVTGAFVLGNTVDTFTGPGTNPVLPNSSGLITVTGGQVAAGTTTHVIQTDSLAANTYTIQIQRSQAVASSTVGDNGVSHFNNVYFTVDGNGFVSIAPGSLVAGIKVDVDTPPGTNPVLPNSSNLIQVTGGQVAAGTTVSVIQTNSLAANTYTIQVQRSQAVATSTIGDNGVCHFNSAEFTVDANGFVSLASTMTPLQILVDGHTPPGTNPVVPNGSNQITITGGQVASGSTTNVITTQSLAANTFTIEIQRSQAVASSTVGDNGVSHFNSTYFTVDSNGFVSIVTGAFMLGLTPDVFTVPGTTPVVPNSSGLITVTGNQIAAGLTPNVIRTDSTVAHQLTIEIQRSQAVASSTVADNGVCHFNSSEFTVDSNGFVSIVGGPAVTKVGVDQFTGPGTNPVLPSATGQITVTGGQVAAGTTANVIQTNSLAANTYTVQIQRSQAAASSTVGDNGVSHFNSAYFTVDSNGFVSILAGYFVHGVTVDASTGPGTNPVVPNTSNLIIVTGGQVAAGTNVHAIQTNSLAANTYTIQIQRSQAVASSTVGDNGICHFNSADFTVDANGFVSLVGGEAITGVMVDTFTGPGTNPVLPNSSGILTVTGGQVAAGTTTNVIQTDSLAANTYTIQIQRSQAVASSTVGDNGVSHFDSAFFTVDSNGFVSINAAATPAFFAYVSTSVNNATGDGTNYGIICDTVLHDNLGNYNSGTGLFTAPRTGFYMLTYTVTLKNINTSGATVMTNEFLINGTQYVSGQAINFSIAASPPSQDLNMGSVYYLTSGQTVSPRTVVTGGTKTVAIVGSGDFGGTTYSTWFSASFLF